MRRLTAFGAAVLVAATIVVPAGAARQPLPARCDALGLSPEFERDGTAFCVARAQNTYDVEPGGVEAYLTTDRGRTWQRRAATGLPFDPATHWSQVLFSPLYPADRSLYVHGTGVGLHRTTDGGATFTPVDLRLFPNGFRPALAGVADAAPQLPGTAAGGVLVATTVPRVLHPPVQRPVPGPVGDPVAFLVPRTAGAPVVAVAEVQEAGYHYSFSTCTAQYACPEVFFSLDRYWNLLGVDLVGVPGRERLVVVAEAVLGPDAGKVAAWRSGDALTRMERYPALEALLPPIPRHETRGVGLATLPDGRLLATVLTRGHERGPSRRLYAGDAAGNRWSFVAYGRSVTERRYGAAGTLPATNTHALSFNRTRVWVARDRIFTLGARDVHGAAGVFCSRDGGRTWRAAC